MLEWLTPAIPASSGTSFAPSHPFAHVVWRTPTHNGATITRFYIMTQTSLSSAALQYRGGPPLWAAPVQRDESVRNSSFQPQASSFQKPWPPCGGHLIADLELEFYLTHRKLSPLRNPNRKFSSLLYLFTNDQSRVTSHRFLIHGSAIKTPRKPFKNNNLTNSNRRQTGGQETTFAQQ